MREWQRQLQFLKGVVSLRQLPSEQGCEVVFSGRSNSGKSSVINALTGLNRLARVSKTPGRTREINFFVHPQWDLRLVDVPGYGYARVSREMRKSWKALLEGYFMHRASLSGVVLIMDIRHPMREHDQHMLAWMRTRGLPIHILLNKADKLSRGAAMQVLQNLAQMESGVVSAQLFSVPKRQGTEELLAVLERWFGIGQEWE
ncbi:MAG: ribosome biogenesis GTP-binding protein YihA/YsxC [Candidatus Eutrophobiaceae bacterium]